MALGVPKSYSVGSTTYFETDLACINVRDSKKFQFPELGSNPIVWYKLDSNGKRIDENIYFLSGVVGIGTQNAKACPRIHLVGNENLPSLWCGIDDPRTLAYVAQTDLMKKVIAPKNDSTVEEPKLAQRNQVYGTRTNTGVGWYVGAENTNVLRANTPLQEILTAWNTYVDYARKVGAANADPKAIYVNQRTTDGRIQTKKITTIEELQAAFPRYFQFDKQFQGSGLLELATGDKGGFLFEGVIYPESYVGLWDLIAKQMGDEKVYRELQDRGYSSQAISVIRRTSGKTLYDLQRGVTEGSSGGSSSGSGAGSGGGGGGGGGSSGGGATTPNGTKWLGPEGYRAGVPQTITVGRSRGIFLSSGEFGSALTEQNIVFSQGTPVMYQVYPRTVNSNGVAVRPLVNDYPFDFAPSEISYSGFGGEWVQIDRNGGFPFVDWKAFKLLQVSFNFLIAKNTSPGRVATGGPATGDGLDLPVTDQIDKLQRMAQTPFPVMFYGLDKLLTNQFRYDDTGSPRGVQFVIQDLSITAQRRNAKLEITRATAQITLQEIPVEKQEIIGMPVLRHKPIIPKEETEETSTGPGLATDALTSPPNNQVVYVTP